MSNVGVDYRRRVLPGPQLSVGRGSWYRDGRQPGTGAGTPAEMAINEQRSGHYDETKSVNYGHATRCFADMQGITIYHGQ